MNSQFVVENIIKTKKDNPESILMLLKELNLPILDNENLELLTKNIRSYSLTKLIANDLSYDSLFVLYSGDKFYVFKDDYFNNRQIDEEMLKNKKNISAIIGFNILYLMKLYIVKKTSAENMKTIIKKFILNS